MHSAQDSRSCRVGHGCVCCPASAIIATLESVNTMRMNRALMAGLPTNPLRTRVPRSFLLAALALPWNTKTDLTLGRSVALIAPLHPKCPFQVRHRRVRAFLLCFLVLGY